MNPELTFDSWFEQQDPKTQSLINDHFQGTGVALEEERDARKRMEKELRSTAKKLKAGSEAEKLLTATADKLTVAERRVNFLEKANGIIDDTKLAWLALNNGEYEDKDGNFDFEKLKVDHPKLFIAKPKAKGHAGSGTHNNDHSTEFSMNDWIRAAAGQR